MNERPTWLKVCFTAICCVGAAFLTLYLAGGIFLLLNKKIPSDLSISTYYQYWYYLHGQAAYVKKLYVSLVVGAGISFGVPVALIILARRDNRPLHGAARFAHYSEVKKSGLMTDKGIIVGKYRDQYLMFGGQQFVLLAAPTRSGKGVGVVIPNLLNWPDSAVVLDIKQENFKKTAGYRKLHGQEVFLFNPFAEEGRTHRYNPLSYIRNDGHQVADILKYGFALYPKEGTDSFWNDQARNLFLGIVLYLCETPELPRTMGEILRQASGKGKPIKEHLSSIIAGRAESGRPLSDSCVHALNRFMSNSENTLSSILATFNAPLTIWANPVVDAATSADDFLLSDVRKKRMTIYIGITPDYLPEAALLINLFFSHLINLNTKELPEHNPELKYQCLLLMDEFAAMGRVAIIEKSVSFMAGYNLRLLTVIQSISQLSMAYESREAARTIITNHALQVLYSPREQHDANEYSEMLGYMTVKGKSRSRQHAYGLYERSSHGESESDHRRALLMPQEIKEIGQWKEIVSLENCKPILCEKIKYFDDPVLKERIVEPPEVPEIDLDLYRAVVDKRLRPITENDVEKGIDLSKLAIDTKSLPEITSEAADPGEIKEFVDKFFESVISDGPDNDDDDQKENSLLHMPESGQAPNSPQVYNENRIELIDVSILERT
jgi:type IV secretion system protein VirD4